MHDIAVNGQPIEKHFDDQESHFKEGGLYSRVGKKALDFSLAIVALPALVPAIVLLWAMVRLDGGPGFFGHQRVGQNGKPFRCWKIRTMATDADAQLANHLASNPQAAEEWARDHKLTDDPRITRLGHFLRKSSLDELPQIWNVLCGQMSFVGPRPIVEKELEKYGESGPAYLSQKPGITGLWQISGRNDVSYQERVDLDVAYLSKRSLRTDLKIIAKTGLVVFDHSGR